MAILVRVGSVLGPFGVQGLLKCEYATDLPELLQHQPRLILSDTRSGECEIHRVVNVQLKPKHFLLQLDGFTAPEPLARYHGWDLLHAVERGQLPREADEVFFFELAGMEVRRPDGRVLGVISDVLQTGAHTVLEVDLGAKRVLIPFIKEHIPEVHVTDGWLATSYPLDQHGITQ